LCTKRAGDPSQPRKDFKDGLKKNKKNCRKLPRKGELSKAIRHLAKKRMAEKDLGGKEKEKEKGESRENFKNFDCDSEHEKRGPSG